MSEVESDQSDQGADQSDRGVKPWTIKNVPPEERNAAIQAARRDKSDLGPWIALAIRQKIQADRQADRAPARVIPEPAGSPTVDVDSLERMMRLAEQYQGLTGKAPRTHTGPLSRLIGVGLRSLAGPTRVAASPTGQGA